MAKKSVDNSLIKEKCFQLFSSSNILYNRNNSELDEEYSKMFEYKQIKSVFSDEDLVKTAELFFENNLVISSASKVGFMHRNTLIYRLDKIQKLIGLDIRNFADAVIFNNMLLYQKFLQDKM